MSWLRDERREMDSKLIPFEAVDPNTAAESRAWRALYRLGDFDPDLKAALLVWNDGVQFLDLKSKLVYPRAVISMVHFNLTASVSKHSHAAAYGFLVSGQVGTGEGSVTDCWRSYHYTHRHDYTRHHEWWPLCP